MTDAVIPIAVIPIAVIPTAVILNEMKDLSIIARCFAGSV